MITETDIDSLTYKNNKLIFLSLLSYNKEGKLNSIDTIGY